MTLPDRKVRQELNTLGAPGDCVGGPGAALVAVAFAMYPGTFGLPRWRMVG